MYREARSAIHKNDLTNEFQKVKIYCKYKYICFRTDENKILFSLPNFSSGNRSS